MLRQEPVRILRRRGRPGLPRRNDVHGWGVPGPDDAQVRRAGTVGFERKHGVRRRDVPNLRRRRAALLRKQHLRPRRMLRERKVRRGRKRLRRLLDRQLFGHGGRRLRVVRRRRAVVLQRHFE